MDTKTKKAKILIVDDSEMNRAILADMLSDEFEIIEAVDGVDAVAKLTSLGMEISLVLLDIVMPRMDGFEVLAVMNKHNWISDIPVIMISAESASSYVDQAYELGVTDYISRPFDGLVVHRRVINTILLYAKQKKLIGMVADQIYEKEKSSNLMISILSHIVEFRNGESGLHVLHIRTMTDILLKHLVQKTDRYNIKNEDISLISTASALHDIGKIGIAEEILNKPGRFTKEEFEVMKTHAAIGANMLDNLPYYRNEPLVRVAHQICRWHHERYDGKGYPDGLKGEEIPIAAQIVALADVYDALTSVRVYKPAHSHEAAMQMILNGECGAFNPLLLECLTEIGDTIHEQLRVNSIGAESQKEIRGISEEILRHDELSASERTLRLLEHERTKYQFFASMSKEVQFEFTNDPPIITASNIADSNLNVSEIIMDPMNSDELKHIFGEGTLKGLRTAIHNTTPDAPVIKYDCEILVGEERRWNRVICRSMWTYEEPPRMTGFIGKLVDIHNERVELDDLERKAAHDGLTKLYNHTAGKEIIMKKLEEHPGHHFALAIFDIDFFKKANDEYGHMFGDEVLKFVADKLSASVRSNDVAVRVGGDEFLVFLEYNEGVRNVIERIFHQLLGEYKGYTISISMGIAESRQVGKEYETLFHRADQALYAAKRGGRGQYCFFENTMKDMLSESANKGEEV